MKKWYYYNVETKTGQYGCRIRSIQKRKTKADCLRFAGECEDCAGVRTLACRAMTADPSAVQAAVEDEWGRLGGAAGSGYAPAGGCEIEWL